MAAIFPIDVDELEESVERARPHGVVEIVNLNSPRQQVASCRLESRLNCLAKEPS